MANERLRHAVTQAGLETEQLAELIEVDVKTVDRWLAGRTPHPRLRRRLAAALGRDEHELWPDLATAPDTAQRSADEILGVWTRADDPGVPDWRELLDEATDQLDLLDHELHTLLASGDIVARLLAKAGAGCCVRILVSAPDSLWVRARAFALGQTEEDRIGRSELALAVQATRGYLEPLTRIDGIELRQLYADPGYRILRFDQEMLLTPHLHGVASADAPVLYLRRQRHGGVFDQFINHLETLFRQARPIEPAPELYPDPRARPDRYKPLTASAAEELTAGLEERRNRDEEKAKSAGTPLEQVRAELRRPPEPT